VRGRPKVALEKRGTCPVISPPLPMQNKNKTLKQLEHVASKMVNWIRTRVPDIGSPSLYRWANQLAIFQNISGERPS